MSQLSFVECDTCKAKPGSPLLCAGCIHNRKVIADQQEKLESLRDKVLKLRFRYADRVRVWNDLGELLK